MDVEATTLLSPFGALSHGRQSCMRAVNRVVDQGLSVHTRLERGAPLDVVQEQAALINLVLETPAGDRGTQSRGPRYALVCWLDELFTCHSRWAEHWNEQKLESSLYGGNDRAREFWRQAKLAEAQPTDDALATYFLCVALGFRGQLRGESENLHSWMEKTRTRLARPRHSVPETVWNAPRGRAARPLHGATQVRRFAGVAAVVLIALLPLATFAAAQHLLH